MTTVVVGDLDSTATESVRGPCSTQAQNTIKPAALCPLQRQLGDLQASFVSMFRLRRRYSPLPGSATLRARVKVLFNSLAITHLQCFACL